MKHAEKMVKICQTRLLNLTLKPYQKNAFSDFCQKFPQAMDEAENFVCQFPNPWTLRVSGMGCYTSKCEKKPKSLHPSAQISWFRGKPCTWFYQLGPKKSVTLGYLGFLRVKPVRHCVVSMV
jgi:hypothetical protein